MISLEDSCFYSSVPAEAVTVAILKYASFHNNVDAALWTAKLNLLNKQCFCRNSVR